MPRASLLPGVPIAAVFLALIVGHAQEAHQPGATIVPPPVPFRIDDQLFDIADRLEADGTIKAKPQGATVDNAAFGWRTKFPGWDGGVAPIRFADEITASQRDQFMLLCTTWGRIAQVMCVPHSGQNGYVMVTTHDDPGEPGSCSSYVGQARRLVAYELHLSPNCWNERNIHHEQGHAFGFIHEHQRPDRDAYVTIDLSNVQTDKQVNFTRRTLFDQLGQYDFLSVMHYRGNAFAIDTSKPTIIPAPGYASYAASMGTASVPSDLDHAAIQRLYSVYLRPLSTAAPAESPRTRFDRADFLDAMERLHAFYFSRMGLNRPGGVAINGKPDFQGIATWIFDVYLAARSRGFSAEQSFGMVVADVTQSDEWRAKHPGQASLSRPSFSPVIAFDRNEFLTALQQLDAFYAAPEGLRRPDGLSISGGPDFLGIAAWIFDVYLNERLSGGSTTVAWQRVVNAIQGTQEWKSKH